MILDLPLILETRRNHALEHASLHVLSAQYPDRHMAGHSNPTGFFLLANVPTEAVADAVTQALTRLRAGEKNLAIHAGCGTNLATTTLLAGSLAWIPLNGRKSTLGKLALLPLAIGLGVIGYSLSQPLGPWLQTHVTTEADLGNLQVVDVVFIRQGVHRVITK
ncbi:MAG: DUF6391 domain-containing protein [Chloroflexota bacterium]